MEPSDFAKSATKAMVTCDSLCATFDTTPTPTTRQEAAKILYRLDEISRVVCNVIDAAELCRSTHVDEAWRTAANQAFTTLTDYIGQLNANVNLYRALCTITDQQPTLFHREMTLEEQRFARLLKSEFERDGIHLPDETRERVRQLQNSIVQLEGEFHQNMVRWNRNFGASKADVSDVIPPPVLEQFGIVADANNDMLQLSGNAQILQTLLKFSPSPSLRKQVYMEYNTAVPENLNVLQELRRQRHNLATTLGFDSFADRVLDDNKMAQSTATVHSFLNSLATHNMPLYRREMDLLARAKQQIEGSGNGSGSSVVVEPWDVSYYSTLLKNQSGYDPNEIARYLSLDRCLEAMTILCRDLFGIQMKEEPIADLDRWDGTTSGNKNQQRARCFVFTEEETDRPLGTMYLDLHPRPGKYGHAAHFTVRCGCIVNGPESSRLAEPEVPVHQLPIVALVCNLSSGDGASVLSHGDVETLFHEMGHALHSLLSRTSFQHTSGTRAAMDFVETPSHLMENYVWDPTFLRILARDAHTGAAIPDDLIAKLVQSRHQLRAIERQSQILYATFDQKLFGRPPSPGAGGDQANDDFFSAQASTDIFASLHDKLAIPFAPGTHWHSRFGHLVTYAAGYYGYLYAQEFAREIWNQKLAKGQSLNKQSGQELWRKVLVHGGGKDPQVMLNDLLGRRSI